MHDNIVINDVDYETLSTSAKNSLRDYETMINNDNLNAINAKLDIILQKLT